MSSDEHPSKSPEHADEQGPPDHAQAHGRDKHDAERGTPDDVEVEELDCAQVEREYQRLEEERKKLEAERAELDAREEAIDRKDAECERRIRERRERRRQHRPLIESQSKWKVNLPRNRGSITTLVAVIVLVALASGLSVQSINVEQSATQTTVVGTGAVEALLEEGDFGYLRASAQARVYDAAPEDLREDLWDAMNREAQRLTETGPP